MNKENGERRILTASQTLSFGNSNSIPFARAKTMDIKEARALLMGGRDASKKIENAEKRDREEDKLEIKRLQQLVQKLEEELRKRKEGEAGSTTKLQQPNGNNFFSTGKYVIGLTGNMGCGKKTAAAILEEIGASIIDADALPLQLQRKGTETFNAIVEAFGCEILDVSGHIDRLKLSQLVFSNPAKMKILEGIMHPAMANESVKRIKNAKTQVVVYQGAKLLEAGRTDFCNSVWVVVANREEQISRISKTRGISMEEAAERVDDQMPLNKKAERATVVIENSSDFSNLRAQVVRCWSTISFNRNDFETKRMARLLSLDSLNPTCELMANTDITFGRSEHCTLQLQDITVSKLQCRVLEENGAFYVEDLSRNGTFVNGEKIGKNWRTMLKHGDLICLSKVAVQSRGTRMHSKHSFLFQLYDEIETRSIEFPLPKNIAEHVKNSNGDCWIEKTSATGITYWFNAKTGASTLVQPSEEKN